MKLHSASGGGGGGGGGATEASSGYTAPTDAERAAAWARAGFGSAPPAAPRMDGVSGPAPLAAPSATGPGAGAHAHPVALPALGRAAGDDVAMRDAIEVRPRAA